MERLRKVQIVVPVQIAKNVLDLSKTNAKNAFQTIKIKFDTILHVWMNVQTIFITMVRIVLFAH
jgi:hypothetical protein